MVQNGTVRRTCRCIVHQMILYIHFLIKIHAVLQRETTMMPSVVCWPEYTECSLLKMRAISPVPMAIFSSAVIPLLLTDSHL